MKQTHLVTPDIGLTVLRVDLLHTESNMWMLKSHVRQGRDPVSELLRLARMYRRVKESLTTVFDGPFEIYSAVRIKSGDIVLSECRRTVHRPHVSETSKAESAPKDAKQSRKQSVSSATSKESSALQQTKEPAGAAIGTQPKAKAKPKRTK
jgi:hypothetical protein